MNRREFMVRSAVIPLVFGGGVHPTGSSSARKSKAEDRVTLFVCGDVMTGRGIDQVLPHSNDPRLFEPYVRNARRYVELAESKNGPIPKPVEFSYIWGDALTELERVAPDASIANLETSVTTNDDRRRDKAIHYRMHPDNVSCLTAAGIDCCTLANNHILDWGTAGLEETLDTLERAGIAVAGAGRTLDEATTPAVLALGAKGRVLVFAFGSEGSGIPKSWAATPSGHGMDLLPDLSQHTIRRIAERVRAAKRKRDVVVVSIHWGPNFGYEVPEQQRRFARGLIDDAAVDVVYGHSSHHPKGIEVYRDRPILYGCGDFFNDYEGIPGHEEFRGDLVLMYFLTVDLTDGSLVRLDLSPLQIRRFRLHRPAGTDLDWLRENLNRQGAPFGTRVQDGPDDRLTLRW